LKNLTDVVSALNTSSPNFISPNEMWKYGRKTKRAKFALPIVLFPDQNLKKIKNIKFALKNSLVSIL